MTTMSSTAESALPPTTSLPPVIIDLGKLSRKKAKQLKKGKGPYLEEVLPAIERVKAGLGSNGGSDSPAIVVLFEKKRPKMKSLFRI